MYTIKDIVDPTISIYNYYARDSGLRLVNYAVDELFHEELPYATLSDLPCVQYHYNTGLLTIDDLEYQADNEVKKYLKSIYEEFQTTLLPNIEIQNVHIALTHPEDEDTIGSMKFKKKL